MGKIMYLNFVSVCLGLGDFYTLKEVIDYGTDDAIAATMRILLAIFGKIIIDDDTRLPNAEATDYKVIDDGDKSGFSIKINGKIIKSLCDSRKVNTEEVSGGAYVLFSDGIHFYKFYFSNGETWEDDYLMTPKYFGADEN